MEPPKYNFQYLTNVQGHVVIEAMPLAPNDHLSQPCGVGANIGTSSLATDKSGKEETVTPKVHLLLMKITVLFQLLLLNVEWQSNTITSQP